MFKLALIGSGRDNEYFIYGRVDNFQDVPVLLSILELDDYLDIYSDDDCTQTRQKISKIKFRLLDGNLFILSDNIPAFSNNHTVLLSMMQKHKDRRVFFINYKRYRDLMVDMIGEKKIPKTKIYNGTKHNNDIQPSTTGDFS
jgi:hypothetical protein